MEMDQPHPTQSADQHHPPSLGLEPPEEAEKKKTSSDEEKNFAGKNVYLSFTHQTAVSGQRSIFFRMDKKRIIHPLYDHTRDIKTIMLLVPR